MGTDVKCLECGELIELPAGAVGKKIVCPHCSARLQVEEDGTLVPAGTGAEVTAAPRTAPRVPDRDEDEAAVPRRRRRWRDDEDDDEEEYPRRRRRSFRKTGLTRQQALDKVRAPGIILQIFGVLLILGGLGAFVGLPFAAQAENDPIVGMIVLAFLGIVSLPCGFISFLGGSRLKQLRSRGLILATIIVTFIVAILFCNPAIFVPIWPLVVYQDVKIKEHFDRPVEEIEDDD